MLNSNRPEDLLATALAALAGGDGRSVLDALAAPVYMTDADGQVTYWNQACIDFAGREPQLGHDRWCVTWRLFTIEGEPLPHDECPMATAIRERKAIRTEIAIAMRPDGSRVAFRPYPTPLFDESGQLSGAINLLIDISDEQSAALTDQARRCRRLAMATTDRDLVHMLSVLADNYEDTAESIRHR